MKSFSQRLVGTFGEKARLMPFVLCGIACIILPSISSAEQEVSNRQVMHALVIPSSDELWAILMEDDIDSKGTAYWQGQENSAVQLISAAIVLSDQGPDSTLANNGMSDSEKKAAWEKHIKSLMAASKQALLGAQHKSFDELIAAGDALLETCSTCHQDFYPVQPDP